MITAVAALLPVGVVVASSGVASAGGVIVNNGAPATVTCFADGGTLTLKTPIGLVTPGGYQAPIKNKGQKITVSGVSLTNCTSSVFPAAGFTGTMSGKIAITNPSQTPAQLYSCANLTSPIPGAGGTLSGTLKIKWTPPPGVKFTQKKSTLSISDALGDATTFPPFLFLSLPNVNPAAVVGGFPGPDGGAVSFLATASSQTLGALLAQCTMSGGVSSIGLQSVGNLILS